MSDRPSQPRRGVRSPWVHGLHALLLPLLAAALHVRFARYLHQFPVVLFFPAVFISAGLGGRRWALLSAAVSMSVAGYFVVPSEVTLALHDPGTLLAKAIVATMGVSLTILYVRLQAASKRANDAHDELRRQSDSTVRALMKHSTDVEGALFSEKERAHVTLHSIADGVISTDAEGHVTFLNAAAERLTGWTMPEAASVPLDRVFQLIDSPNADHIGTIPRDIRLRLGGTTADESLTRRDGSSLPIEYSVAPIHDQNGRTSGAVIVFRDVSAARAMTLKIALSALHDSLTELPNRTLFDDRLSQAIRLASREHTAVAVLFLDLDRFKQVNDSLGHAVGDALLRSVADRLRASVRASDTVSRHGGDEFVVLLSPLQRAEQAALVSTKILRALAAPHHLAGHVLSLTASVGISVHPEHGDEPETLIQAADAAMYYAKQRGRSNHQFYTADMKARHFARQALEVSLRSALQRQELTLHYQPKVNLATSVMTGVEALIRWHHPTRGLVAPAEFIPEAEECGLIQPLGRWALRQACCQAREWRDAGLRPLPIAVNVSTVELSARDFLDHIVGVLEETGTAPNYLELEVTESVLMADTEATKTSLHALKALGIQLAIDDFGTGYSSLSYLSRFPIASLKIDRSFLRDLSPGAHEPSIIQAVIGMARALGLRVVAEGVEHESQFAWLRRTSCDEAQGYYFSRPVAADQFTDLLRQDRPLALC